MYNQSNLPPKWLQQLDALEDEAYNLFIAEDKKSALQKYLALEKKYSKLKLPQRRFFNYKDKLANVQSQIGRCYSQLNLFNEAIGAFKKTLALSSFRLDVRFELAVATHSLHDFQTAKAYAKEIIDSDGKEYLESNLMINKPLSQIKKETYLLLANIAEAEGNEVELKEYAEKGGAFRKLAEIALKEKSYEQAIQYSRKVIADKSSDKLSLCLAYYYWAKGVIFPLNFKIENESELESEINEEQISQKRLLAISLLDKSCSLLKDIAEMSVEKKAPIYFELALLYEANTSKQDHKKAAEFYELAIEGETPKAMHNLGVKYEKGEGIEKDLIKAFNLYFRAAKLGFIKAQTDLARCYIHGIGCEINLEQAAFWAEKASEEAPLAKHYLAGVLLKRAQQINDSVLGQKALSLFTEAADAEIKFAYLNLGRIYQFGIFTEKNFLLAESYYRHAIRLEVGNIAIEHLLALSQEILQSTAIGDANYDTIVSTCREIIIEIYGKDIPSKNKPEIIAIISEKIKAIKKEEFSFFVKQNRKIKSVYDYRYLKPEEKINQLLIAIQPEKANTINLSTIFLKLGELFDRCQLSTAIFQQHQGKINKLIEACLNKFNIGAFSIRSLCNLITGLCRLFKNGYLPSVENLLGKIFERLTTEKNSLPLFDFASILSAACRTSLKNPAIVECLQTLVNQFLFDYAKYIAARDDLSSVVYSLAILDNYARLNKDFKLEINNNLLLALLSYAIENAENKLLKIESRHGYFLAALYFSYSYPQLTDPAGIKRIQQLRECIEFKNISTHKSALQKEVYSYVSAGLVGCQEEIPINTLPVDIKYKNHIIRVNGPSHYLIVDEAGNHKRAPKDELNCVLLNCHFDKEGKPFSQSRYVITDIDYREYEKDGKRYIRKALENNGLILPNLVQNTSKFHQSISAEEKLAIQNSTSSPMVNLNYDAKITFKSP